MSPTHKPPTPFVTLSRARRLRHDQTGHEKALWSLLRNRGLGGLKFRRQHPIGPFIADFVCDEKKLVIEVDGDSHIGNKERDVAREDYLRDRGYRVLRLDNDDVLCDLGVV